MTFDPETERRLPYYVRKHPPNSPERAAALERYYSEHPGQRPTSTKGNDQ